MNCSVFSVRKYNYTVPHYAPHHNHPFFEINVYMGGTGYTTIRNKRYDFEGPCFAFIPPNANHDEQFLSPGDVICIVFETDALPFECPSDLIPVDEKNPLLTYATLMFKEATEKDDYHVYIHNHLLKILLSEIHRCLSQEVSTNRSLETVRKYINENFYKKLSFTELADMSGYSYDYFRHYFKKQYGISPQNYLVQVRLDNAYSILSSTPDHSITEVAADCGFSDCSQFSAMFTRRFGITPKRFAKSMKEKYKS